MTWDPTIERDENGYTAFMRDVLTKINSMNEVEYKHVFHYIKETFKLKFKKSIYGSHRNESNVHWKKDDSLYGELIREHLKKASHKYSLEELEQRIPV